MITKERIQKLKDWCNKHDSDLTGINTEMYEAISALEKADRYRWHDLRKDPENLPKHDKMVWLYGEIWESDFDYCIDRCIDGVWQCMDITKVIAWREIEPFEGENDEGV